MPKMIADEGTEYDDGTAATESQQAKVIQSLVRPPATLVITKMSCSKRCFAVETTQWIVNASSCTFIRIFAAAPHFQSLSNGMLWIAASFLPCISRQCQ